VTNLEDVRDFLAQHRIAMVGVSRNPKDFSRLLFRELSKRGYDMVPVNPAADKVEDCTCVPRVQDIHPAPEAALIMTASPETANVVQDCAAAGVKRVWMYRAGGQGAINQEAVAFCHEHGIRLVEGHCPYMFLAKPGFIHRFHGFVLKVVGSYPAHENKAA
jgi:predicted CoA-binding protein